MSRTGLWDSHAHLDSDYYTDDREELIAKLREDLDGVINPGCNAESSAAAVALAEKHDFIYAAVGWHPEDLQTLTPDYLDMLANWAKHPKVVAIGEVGLDYYWKENEPKEVQKRVLLEEMDLAVQFDLPVIIHDREAHGDIMEIFQKEAPKGLRAVFHCFSGSLEMAKELVKRGYYLGFGGTSTYKNAQKVREVLAYVPDDLLLFETDSPYLTPVPYRGKRNHPGYTELVAQNAAIIRGTSFERIAEQTTKNVKTLFTKIK